MPEFTQSMTVVQRLLRLVVLLQNDGPWGRSTLAEVLGVSTKTVSRDIARLQAGGIPAEHDPVEQTFRIRTGFFMPPVDLTVAESVALSVLAARPDSADGPGSFLAGHAAQAVEKLRAGLPAVLRDELRHVLPAITVAPARSEAGDAIDDAWFTVSKALGERRALQGRYEPIHSEHDDAGQFFRLDPYALHFGQRAWYVIGRRHDRPDGKPRMLKLSRFVQLEPLDIPCAPPDGWSLKTHFGNAWRMIPGDGRRHAVQLRFEPKFADTVAETQWHPTQRIEEHPDASITAHFDIDGLDEIVWWILGYGPACEVIAPDELRHKVAELAQATARRYTP